MRQNTLRYLQYQRFWQKGNNYDDDDVNQHYRHCDVDIYEIRTLMTIYTQYRINTGSEKLACLHSCRILINVT